MATTEERWAGWYAVLDGHTVVPVTDRLVWDLWWATQGREERRVARDRVGDASVSTVFLPLNHQTSPDGPPLWFETMVFWDGGPLDQETERYETWEEAEEGHRRMVARVREAMRAPEEG